MSKLKLSQMVSAIAEVTWLQRRELIGRLQAAQGQEQVHAIVEDRMQTIRLCPHCHSPRVVRNGQAQGLQRYKCRGCGKTFNALTGTPLARLRCRPRWMDQAQVLLDGASITKAAQLLGVARSTAFRWRHRFLALPHHVKSGSFSGIVEADETCILKSCKGQRRRLARRQLS